MRKRYIFFISLLFIVVAALRGPTVGTDTASYIKDYYRMEFFSYPKIWEAYGDNPGYFLLSKIFVDLGISVQIWFGIVAISYVVAISKLIAKFSKDISLSYIMFLALGYYSFSLAGLKQVFAMAIVLWAFNYLIEKKYIRYFFLMILGSVFHISCLIFLFAFFIVLIRKSKRFYWILGIISVFCIINYNLVFNTLLQFLNHEHYNDYLELEGGYSPTIFVVQLIILFASIIYIKQYSNENKEECRVFVGMTCLGIVNQAFAFVVASAFRMSMYYSIFSIVLLPNCFSTIKDIRMRRILKIGAAFVFIFFFIYTNRNGSSVVPYKFYWSH